MSQFTNDTVVKAANMYFDGKVVSRTVLFPDGSKKTLGVMQPGDYEFGTSQAEVMEIMAHIALNLFTNYVNVAFAVPLDFPHVKLRAK